MFIVAWRRQYRQDASKLMRITWTSTQVGCIGAFEKTASIRRDLINRSRARNGDRGATEAPPAAALALVGLMTV
jgi:hypothetical protein